MTTPPSPPPPANGGTPRYYFAYGSNQHVAQMAQRCPSSRFAGVATLRRHRWQINERGVANVVPTSSTSSSSSPEEERPNKEKAAAAAAAEEVVVEGLLYVLVDPADEKTLDIHEGVAAGCYEKRVLDVEVRHRGGLPVVANGDVTGLAAALRKNPPLPQQHRDSDDDDDGKDDKDENDGEQQQQQQQPPRSVPALVYLSTAYTTDGPIRTEYAGRMERAAADAVALGVPAAYVARYLLPVLRGETCNSGSSSSSSSRSGSGWTDRVRRSRLKGGIKRR